ncbi:MAG: UDP-N-acetylglucosamine 2-epimerase (non-hydrolyzing) [Gammaproteobacteria bacterium]|nr:MAG: UDP-N-acetylglucosamine 2-epimerase (non-hydrolyzing) [Gammaproteobacteria bacterium]
MQEKTIHLIAGARPNFMKIAPIVRALEGHGWLRYRVIHTGQHYDREMSEVFFEELGIPAPDRYLEAGGGSHAEQTARIMERYEKVCMEESPDLVVVVGDVNSTLACSVVAKKLHVPVAHVEAGLRSGDMRMPEEVNRVVTDAISDLYFVTERAGVDQLLAEGKPQEAIHFVGHVMIDNLYYQLRRLEEGAADRISEALKAEFPAYGVVTLHRPSNVDQPETLAPIIGALSGISRELPLIFPVHPRTRGNLERFGIDVPETIRLTAPLPYMAFLNLWKDARVVLTDSGGIQEETTALGVPCITIRENTERPVTVEQGTNVLVGTDPQRILEEAGKVLAGQGRQGRIPELWDGRAAERIVEVLERSL